FAEAFGHGEAPVHQVAYVRENFRRRTRSFREAIAGKAWPGVANRFRSAIGEGSKGVAQEHAGVGHDFALLLVIVTYATSLSYQLALLVIPEPSSIGQQEDQGGPAIHARMLT